MKFYYDTEFIEGVQERPLMLKSRLGHWMLGYPKPTIDLISIGIVSEDDREYYAVSKEFNLKEAWNRFDVRCDRQEGIGHQCKEYWLRENVLRPIFDELVKRSLNDHAFIKNHFGSFGVEFTYDRMKTLINFYGKTNKEIAVELCEFIDGRWKGGGPRPERGCFMPADGSVYPHQIYTQDVELYGYYADYDHVVLSWIFGKMTKLPEGFPKYTRDLKQILDEKYMLQENKYPGKNRLEAWLMDVKRISGYPKQTDEHHALADAKWNKKFHEFLSTL